MTSLRRLELTFQSHGVRCAGWLFLPDTQKPAPVVVMAHGFSGVRDVRLPAYAEHFGEHGLAVFVFDYRHFGDSEGQPRQLLSWAKQLQDWRAALTYVRGMKEVDGSRIGLWGTSFAGGHVIVTASREHSVRAVVAQVPHVDGLASLRTIGDAGFLLRAVVAGVRDLVQSAFGQGPHYVAAVSPPEDFACLNRADSYSGFLSLIPPQSTWRNQVAARILLTLGAYRPIAYAAQVQCPTLIVAARNDSLIPLASVRSMAKRLRHGRLKVVGAGHFEVYTGELFEHLVELEAGFLAEHLSVPSSLEQPEADQRSA